MTNSQPGPGDLALHEQWMAAALQEARTALALGEIPVGAVIVHGGQIIARAGNRRETDKDPTAHGEILALKQAAQHLGRWRLTGCTLYVTLEPCPMCAGAIALARLDALYYGAADRQTGCCGSIYRLTEDPALGLAAVPAHGGLLGEECARLITQWFQHRRQRP